jgi:hypothetical protein
MLSPTPVLPAEVPLQRNPGVCSADSPFRGLPLAQVPDQADLAWNALPAAQRYTPTALLKVSSPEQLQQEWLASKGPAALAAMRQHLRAIAARQHRPMASLIAGADGDD